MAVPAVPATSWAQGRSREEQQRRNEIRIMEGVLVQAVRLGAEIVSNELERFEPAGVTVLQGAPRARGFVLDGYGVFFDVEIPDMNQSVVWSMMSVQRDRQFGNALDSLRAAVEYIPEGPNRQQARMALQQVTKTVVGSTPPQPAQEPVTPASASGQVTAASTPVPDPDRLYSDAVKSALARGHAQPQLADESPGGGVVDRRGSRQRRADAIGQLVGLDHDRAARQGQRSRDLSRRPDQA